MKKAEDRLLRIRALLKDAEEREIRDEQVKVWLYEIKQLMYDYDDVLEEAKYELLREQIEGSSSVCAPRKRKLEQVNSEVSSLTSSSYAPSSTFDMKKLLGDINAINERFDEIGRDRRDLKLREEEAPRSRSSFIMKASPTCSYVDESVIYGRDQDVETIVKLLLSGEEKFLVTAIVGMGGLGKTTVARLIYKHPSMPRHFTRRGWVYVSNDFDVVRLVKATINSLTKKPCYFNNRNRIEGPKVVPCVR
jgi:hypothetical protein